MILRIGGLFNKMFCCFNKTRIFGSFFNFFNQFIPVRYFVFHKDVNMKFVYKTFGAGAVQFNFQRLRNNIGSVLNGDYAINFTIYDYAIRGEKN